MSDQVGSDDPDAIGAAITHLRAGRAVVLPTDTVYGLAVLPSVAGATDRLFAAKGRPATVPISVLVDSLDQALGLVEPPGPALARVIERWWPGPLTIVFPRRRDVTVALGGDGTTIGVRCPDHDLVCSLARELGPLAVTSANRHGEPTPTAAAGAAAALGDAVALVIDGGPCPIVPSTVIDGTTPDLPVLRPGPISAEQIARAAQGKPPPNR
ncbi:MAG: L-threonylcarbamoyladenylate synthase [Acidimicrobiales bacterium]